jgi:single-strand DNA-binding protein
MNNVSLVGRLTKDGELRYTQNGVATFSFTLAVDDPFAKGEKKADFINIVVWQKTAENAANYLRKGHMTGVTGRINTRNYEKDGKKVYITEVIASDIRFLEPKGNKTDSPPPKHSPFKEDEKPIDISDDDLPF